mgnify:CR=1
MPFEIRESLHNTIMYDTRDLHYTTPHNGNATHNTNHEETYRIQS